MQCICIVKSQSGEIEICLDKKLPNLGTSDEKSKEIFWINGFVNALTTFT